MPTLMCTVYDVELNIPELYSKENDRYSEPLGSIQDSIRVQSKLLAQSLKKFFGDNLTIEPYLTYPSARYGNQARTTVLRTPTLLVTDSTAEADTYIITIKDETAYTVLSLNEGLLSSGVKHADYTCSNGLFKIEASKWRGEFNPGDTFVFAYQTHEDTLRLLCSYSVACKLLRGRYVSESADSIQGLQLNYCQEAKDLLAQITEGVIDLECADATDSGTPDSRETWQGYNVDEMGILRTPPTT